MSNFLLDDRDFESCKGKVRGSDITLEIHKLDNINYAIFEHKGNSVTEVGCYTKQELRLLWRLLTINGE